jgi:predicted PurR-regulated permease PerM
MGASTSSTNNVDESQLSHLQSGVRVSGKVFEDLNTKVNEAYRSGFEDGSKAIQNSVEKVIAQYNDELHNQIVKIQTEQLQIAEKKVKTILFSFLFIILTYFLLYYYRYTVRRIEKKTLNVVVQQRIV